MEIISEYEPDIDLAAHSAMDINQILKSLAAYGLSADEILAGSELTLAQIQDYHTLISFRQKLKIFANIKALSTEPDIALKLGQKARFSDFGFLGYAVISSATVGEAIFLGFKYIRLAGPVFQKKIKLEGDQALFEGIDVLSLGDLLPFCCEYWFSAINALCADAINHPFPSRQIRFPYPPPDYAECYEQTFNCPVTFNSDTPQWYFDPAFLQESLPRANALTTQMCIQSCDELLKIVARQDCLADRISDILLKSAGRFPNADQVAEQLNTSSRSMSRQLKKEGLTFQQVLDNTRKSMAMEYLTQTQLTIEEIASRVGYSEASNFRNAFKNWTGMTPKAMRENH